MKPDPKKHKDKSILAYVRELEKLRRLTWYAPVVKLDKPYQNGWTKYFILRDDYTRRTDAHVFHAILKKIGTEAFCRKLTFADRQGKPYGPHLRIIGKNEWEMLGWGEQFRKHFTYGIHNQKEIWGWTKKGIEGYKMTRPFFFVEAIKPHFVTHVRTIIPDVESRIAYINRHFDQEQLWRRYHKLKGARRHSYDWRCSKDLFMEAIGTKEIENYDKSE
jgi:hypothetical protein